MRAQNVGFIQAQKSFRKRGFQLGVTLVELMTVLGVMGVILSIGIPSLSSFTAAAKVESVSDALQSAVTQARYRAVQSGQSTQFFVNKIVSNCDSQTPVVWAVVQNNIAVSCMTRNDFSKRFPSAVLSTQGSVLTFGSIGFANNVSPISINISEGAKQSTVTIGVGGMIESSLAAGHVH